MFEIDSFVGDAIKLAKSIALAQHISEHLSTLIHVNDGALHLPLLPERKQSFRISDFSISM